MKAFKSFAMLLAVSGFAAVSALALANTPSSTNGNGSGDAGVIGVAPVCPYGYYDRAPYDCAPYGYYGSEWFQSGIFIGVGPWFHGEASFRGPVNENFDAEHGYTGALPQHGDMPDPANRLDKVAGFKETETLDSKGHAEAVEKVKKHVRP